MKTPREILLDRHKSAEPQLDSIRRKVIANVSAAPDTANDEADSRRAHSLWRQWWLPFRWHLAGLGAAWLMVAMFNLESSPGSSPVVLAKNDPEPRQFLSSLRENRRQLAKWLGMSAEADAAVAPPSPFVPKRRSEIHEPIAMA